MTWWLQVHAHAQLQEIVPALAAQGAAPAERAEATGDEADADPVASAFEQQESLGFSGQGLNMSYEGGAPGNSAGYQEFERALREAAWTAGQPQVAFTSGSEVAGGQQKRLPGLETLTGSVKGMLVASGGTDGASSVHVDVKGERWNWGPIMMQSLNVTGTLDGQAGLQLERLQAEARSTQYACLFVSIFLSSFRFNKEALLLAFVFDLSMSVS
jgi:hypothetical protein